MQQAPVAVWLLAQRGDQVALRRRRQRQQGLQVRRHSVEGSHRWPRMCLQWRHGPGQERVIEHQLSLPAQSTTTRLLARVACQMCYACVV
jgi:hypothetical protein